MLHYALSSNLGRSISAHATDHSIAPTHRLALPRCHRIRKPSRIVMWQIVTRPHVLPMLHTPRLCERGRATGVHERVIA